MDTMKGSLKVIDSDAHFLDKDELIKPYLAKPFRSRRLPYLPWEAYDRTLGGTLSQPGTHHTVRLAAMDKQGIDTAVLYPTGGLLIGRIREPAYAAALCRAYNDFIADYC